MKSKPLPTWSFLLVGILMILYAQFIKTRENVPKEAMNIFTFIGIVFLVIGVAKLLFKLYKAKFQTSETRAAKKVVGLDVDAEERRMKEDINREYAHGRNPSIDYEKRQANSRNADRGNAETREGRRHAAKTHPQPNNIRNKKLDESGQQVGGPQTIVYCPSCRARNYNTSQFCHMCGGSLHSLPKQR